MTDETEIRLVYITMPDAASATILAHALVKERLVACVNILPGAISVYAWQGEVTESPETIMIAKTIRAHLGAVTDFVRTRHPYECPAILVLPATATVAFADWVKSAVL